MLILGKARRRGNRSVRLIETDCRLSVIKSVLMVKRGDSLWENGGLTNSDSPLGLKGCEACGAADGDKGEEQLPRQEIHGNQCFVVSLGCDTFRSSPQGRVR